MTTKPKKETTVYKGTKHGVLTKVTLPHDAKQRSGETFASFHKRVGIYEVVSEA